jgi:hypothetical protein
LCVGRERVQPNTNDITVNAGVVSYYYGIGLLHFRSPLTAGVVAPTLLFANLSKDAGLRLMTGYGPTAAGIRKECDFFVMYTPAPELT